MGCVTRPVSTLLRELREERKTSLRSAARDLAIDPSYLSRIERGEKGVSPTMKKRIARYYEVEPELIAVAGGDVPPDVLEILRRNPEVIRQLRAEYGASS